MKLIANAATMSKKSEEQNRLDQRRNRFQDQPKITIPKSVGRIFISYRKVYRTIL